MNRGAKSTAMPARRHPSAPLDSSRRPEVQPDERAVGGRPQITYHRTGSPLPPRPAFLPAADGRACFADGPRQARPAGVRVRSGDLSRSAPALLHPPPPLPPPWPGLRLCVSEQGRQGSGGGKGRRGHGGALPAARLARPPAATRRDAAVPRVNGLYTGMQLYMSPNGVNGLYSGLMLLLLRKLLL